MRFKLSKGKFLVGILSFIMAFVVCTPAVFAEDPPLCVAAQNGDLKEVKRLVDEGADVNDKDKEGKTPLYYAYDHMEYLVSRILNRSAYDDFIELLPGEEINLSGQTIYMPPAGIHITTQLLREAWHENLEIVKLLLEHGADANLTKGDTGDTPLHCAAKIGNIEVGILLIEKGNSYVNRRNRAGETPIIVAKKNKNFGFAQMLIKHGATDEEPSNCLVM